MGDRHFKIVNALNHNAIMCQSLDTNELYILFGKGIGFKKKKGDLFDYNKNVENELQVLETKEANQYKDLLKTVENEKLISVVQNIVYEANKFFGGRINAKLNLTLLDHLNFALERQKNGIVMNYPFLNELKFIYPNEYEFSQKAYHYINEELNEIIHFDEAELGFLVLHIHAAINGEKVSKVLLSNEIKFACTKIIEDSIGEKLDRSSIYYARFTKHLEFAIQRYKNGIKLQNDLLNSIKNTCLKDYEIAKRINDFLAEKYRIVLDENELGYLTLHIYNLRNRKNQY